MARREKVSRGRVLAWVRVASVSRSLELLLRKIASKFNFQHLKSHRALVNKYCATVELVKAKHPLPLEGRVSPLCGLYWGELLDMVWFFVSVPKDGI